MKTLHKTPSSRSGWTMLLAVFVSFVAVAMAASMLTTTLATSREAAQARHGAEARFVAEAAMEVASNRLPAEISAGRAPAGGTVNVGTHTATYTVQPTGFSTTLTDPSGIVSDVDGFEINATTQVRGHRAAASRIVNVRRTPLFQYAVFYNGALEIQPGANMTIRGRIHTNADLHMGTNGVLTLDTNYVRAVGKVYGKRKDDPATSKGDIRIRKWVGDPFDPAEPAVYSQLRTRPFMDAVGVTGTTGGYDSEFTSGHDDNGDGDFDDAGDWLPWALGALEYWREPAMYAGGTGNTLKSGVHGVPPAEPPPIGSIAAYETLPGATGGDWDWDAGNQTWVASAPGAGAFAKGPMNAQADLSFLVNPNGTWKAVNGAGIDVSSDVAAAVTATDIFDARQAGGSATKNPVFEVDVAALNASGRFPANGLLYASWSTSGQGTSARGIQLVNGAELNGPLTVVTENPLYVEGDFNTVAKKPAAVIADAVNLLSNSWDDSKTSGGAVPMATTTTYNMAMVTGGPESSVGNYSGGFENLPRFHENWSGIDCNITGSFVKLWDCQYATGQWSDATYNPPRRMWGYDETFNDATRLPPFTPVEVSSVDVVSWYL